MARCLSMEAYLRIASLWQDSLRLLRKFLLVGATAFVEQEFSILMR